ncbi:PatB family C-S lyase [Niveibacterium sp. 24ML]|uniref:MalY/PatB family protein n=1 Tax=Niveibacterium sp. 24ML TaxID=2985512 RepID=UPI00226DA0D2|nr:PatB family C-S lyase [Niveibacterium sp. 24ML]MCX9158069.1 PatB family C-S lyase [Niveibacterium sp. 24ML]
MFDFDTPLALANRSHSMKWARYAGRDVLPMWVADMDFAAPPAVTAALHEAVSFGLFTYSVSPDSLTEAVLDHLARSYRWQVEPDWLVWLPGLVCGINLAVRAATEPGDGVFAATPVYPPFLSAPGLAERRLERADLVRGATRWEWDFDAVNAALARSRLWLLCHPHNPVGRAWDADELARIADLVVRHDVLVCSDEIHCGLVLDPAKRHVPLAALNPDIARRSITLMAPSKTFNIPGLGAAFAVIPDAGLRRRFARVMAGIVPHVNMLGLIAMEAAFREGEPWRLALIDYLAQNARQVAQTIAALPGVKMTPVEATYLAWIDCREHGLAHPAPHFEAAGLGLSDGRDFGAPGFVRLNFGCPRSTLDEGLARFARALSA